MIEVVGGGGWEVLRAVPSTSHSRHECVQEKGRLPMPETKSKAGIQL